MSETFQNCLASTVTYLQGLQEQGVRYVPVAPETLAALARPAPAPSDSRASASSPSHSLANTGLPSGESPSSGSASTVSAEESEALPAPARKSLSGEAKETAMAELRQRASGCERCPNLVAARTQVVIGVGDVHSPLMFVGEAPGADEDRQGEPFVGRAGQLLTKIIQTMGFDRDTVYIGNILKCRPDTPGQTSGNRKPTAAEMKTCLPYLLEQIDIIQPRVIVALGATAVEGLLGQKGGITKLRGHWQVFHGTPVMPTYHPAYLLRNQSLTEKRKVWEDMLQVLERLECPISERQRSYFLTAR